MARIVYVTPNSPFPADRGGRLRAHHLWRSLSEFAETIPLVIGDRVDYASRLMVRLAGGRLMPRRGFASATLLANGEVPAGHAAPGLWEAFPPQDFPDEIWSALDDPRSLNRHRLNARRIERVTAHIKDLAPDLIVLCDTGMAVLADALSAMPGKLVIAPHNMDSMLYASLAEAAGSAAYRRWGLKAAAAFAAAERRLPLADQLWVCSDNDAGRFAPLVDPNRIRLVPNVVEARGTRAPKDTRNIVFIGPQSYRPNELAALELIRISRTLSAQGVRHRMQLIGGATPAVRAAAASAADVEILGYVTSVTPFLREAAMVAAPLTVGGGTRLKLLEAMVWGLPVVTTSIGIEGIAAGHGVHAIIEDDLARFPDRIAALLREPDRARAMGETAREMVIGHYGPAAMRQAVAEGLVALGMSASAQPARRALPAIAQTPAARLNRFSGLLEVETVITTPIPAEALDAGVECGGASLPNATIGLSQSAPYQIRLQGCVVLSPATEPGDVRFNIFYQDALLISVAAGNLVEEEAGFVSLESAASGQEIRVDIWKAGPAPVLELDGAAHALTPGDGIESVTFGRPEVSDTLVLRTARDPGRTAALGFGSWLKPVNHHSTRFEDMRQRHAGETAWLIGNGPSVRLDDLDALSGVLSFGFNRLHLAYPSTTFRPTYTVSSDRQMIEDFGQEIIDLSAGTVFLTTGAPPPLVGSYIWLRQMATFPPLFSRDAARAVNPGGSSLFVAMQIGFFMGIRKFYIYGADFKFDYGMIRQASDVFRAATGENNHFIANYRSGRAWCPPSYPSICAGFLCARRLMESEGGWVRNATRGGLLEIFERVPFEEAVAELRTGGDDAVRAET